MELMDTSLDKFYRKVLDKNMTIPEDILGEICLYYLGGPNVITNVLIQGKQAIREARES